MQLTIALLGCVVFVTMLLFFPETSHPGTRGIDKRRLECSEGGQRSDLVFINPIKSLWLLRSPNLLAVVSTAAF
jgi:hypothetical protein